MKRSSRKGRRSIKSYRRSRSKASRNSRTNQKGGLLYNSMIKRNIKEAINGAISAGKTTMFGAESVSGTMIKVELNKDIESPFISTSLGSMGTPIKNLLLKIVCIHSSGSSKKVQYPNPNNPNQQIQKDASTPTDFINEVAIQQDIYTKTNMLGESLCPAIIGAFILEPHTNDYLVTSLKRIKVLNPLIVTLQQDRHYRIGLIAMELLNGYNTLGNEITTQRISTNDRHNIILASYYAFIRLCSIGYRHNDLHMGNLMVNKTDTDYAGNYQRAMVIDFGRTTRFGHNDNTMKLRYMNVIVNNPLNLTDSVYIKQLSSDYMRTNNTDGYFDSNGYFYPENFFMTHLQTSDLNYIDTHIHDYRIERQKKIVEHIISNKYHHSKGADITINNTSYKIAPIQYKNTGNTLQSFNKLISNKTNEETEFKTIFDSLNKENGMDFDFTLIIQTGKTNAKIQDYYASPKYNEIVNNQYLPSTLYSIIQQTVDYLQKVNTNMKTMLLQIQQDKTKAEQEKIKAEQEKDLIELEKINAEQEREQLQQETDRLKKSLMDIKKKMDDATRTHIVNILSVLARILNTKGYGSYIQKLNDDVVRVATVYSNKYKNKIITDEIISRMNDEILNELTDTIRQSISSTVANDIIDELNQEFKTNIPKYEQTPQQSIMSPIQRSNMMMMID